MLYAVAKCDKSSHITYPHTKSNLTVILMKYEIFVKYRNHLNTKDPKSNHSTFLSGFHT